MPSASEPLAGQVPVTGRLDQQAGGSISLGDDLERRGRPSVQPAPLGWTDPLERCLAEQAVPERDGGIVAGQDAGFRCRAQGRVEPRAPHISDGADQPRKRGPPDHGGGLHDVAGPGVQPDQSCHEKLPEAVGKGRSIWRQPEQLLHDEWVALRPRGHGRRVVTVSADRRHLLLDLPGVKWPEVHPVDDPVAFEVEQQGSKAGVTLRTLPDGRPPRAWRRRVRAGGRGRRPGRASMGRPSAGHRSRGRPRVDQPPSPTGRRRGRPRRVADVPALRSRRLVSRGSGPRSAAPARIAD